MASLQGAHALVVTVFFFSSRRRHTRWPRDWSSDVCSSDLSPGIGLLGRALLLRDVFPRPGLTLRGGERRSEERRVGKERRWRGSAGHEKRKRSSGVTGGGGECAEGGSRRLAR